MALDELLKSELNHEEPPWRTLINKRIKETKVEKNKIKPCDDLDGGSDEMAEENLNSGKEKMKTLGLEFIHQEQTPKEVINHLDEIRIRFIVCLSFIKLNWWQAMDLAYYLFQ